MLSVLRGTLVCVQLCDRLTDSFQIWQVYAVALGNFLRYAAVTFQPIREVTWSKMRFLEGRPCPDDNF